MFFFFPPCTHTHVPDFLTEEFSLWFPHTFHICHLPCSPPSFILPFSCHLHHNRVLSPECSCSTNIYSVFPLELFPSRFLSHSINPLCFFLPHFNKRLLHVTSFLTIPGMHLNIWALKGFRLWSIHSSVWRLYQLPASFIHNVASMDKANSASGWVNSVLRLEMSCNMFG